MRQPFSLERQYSPDLLSPQSRLFTSFTMRVLSLVPFLVSVVMMASPMIATHVSLEERCETQACGGGGHKTNRAALPKPTPQLIA